MLRQHKGGPCLPAFARGPPALKRRFIQSQRGGYFHAGLLAACGPTPFGFDGLKLLRRIRACGLAQGMDFPSSVAPFILRGITLAGIDSVMAPRALREAAWARLAQDLDTAQLERMTREVNLADAISLGAEILAGQVRGRVVVNVNG